ncbi:MAG: hypothetical protein WD972_02255 [Candidatus Andersenbacteria bacterium]
MIKHLVFLSLILLLPSAAWAQDETVSPTLEPQPTASAEKTEVDTAVEATTKNQEELEQKKAEIAELDKKINDLKSKRDTTEAQAELIAVQLKRLEQQLVQATLELKQTHLSIVEVGEEKKDTENDITKLQAAVTDKREKLKVLIRALYEQEQQSFMRVFFMTGSLSDVLAVRVAYQQLQDQHITLVKEIRGQEEDLRKRQVALEQQQQDLGELQRLLAAQEDTLADQQSEQQRFLKAKKQQQVEYDNRLVEAQQARQEIQQNLFTLKNAGVQLSLTEATDIARYASKLTGVRAAVLLGVLKVETNLGTNLGSGVYPEDMQPASRDAFLRVTAKLGLDPAKAPISARPRSYQGWGGAMGPGQFMPSTWEGIEGRVGQLMGKAVPNPYELTDAFVATALFLADRGATDRAKEYEAVNRYLAGPNWQRFTWYGDRVLAVAKEYEKEGL